jgi:hypothetical protein
MKRLTGFLLLAALAIPATAQTVRTDDPWCERNSSWHSDYDETHCEVREFTLAPRRSLDVNAGQNGGISVEAWDRNETRLLARVEAKAESSADARRLAEEVEIETSGTIRPRVPKTGRRAWASVSFKLMVPRFSNLDLEADNGGISIDGVTGDIRFDTQNGGVSLTAVGGDVRGRTTNGGLSVTLTGDRWDGDGLDAQTTNGGVQLVVPDGYSADLETGTVNGGLRIDFPVMVQGDVGRRVETTLGEGGAPIRALTTNGGVKVERG